MVETQSHICLLIFVGLPACGKTSVAKQFQRSVQGVQVVSIDDLFATQSETDTVKAWHITRQQALEMTRSIIESRCATTVIVDDNFEYKSMRKPYLRLAQACQIAFAEVALPCSTEDSIRNNQTRSPTKRVTNETILNLSSRIEYPEGNKLLLDALKFHQDLEYSILIIEALKYIVKTATIQEQLESEVPSLEDQQNAMRAKESCQHILDLALRKKINFLLQTNPSLRQKAKQMSEIKKKILDSVVTPEQAIAEFEERVKIELM